MAELKSIVVSRYRSFKEKTRLSVTPIVIMIGKNGSGKSVISRLMIILSDSLHEGKFNQPINLIAGGVRHASEFADIPHMKSSLPFEIGAEIEVEGTSYEFNASIRYVKETDSLILEGFTILKGNGESLKITLADDSQLEENKPKYKGQLASSSISLPISGFFGFIPILDNTEFEEWIQVLEYFKLAIPPVSYLGPFRTEVGSFVGSPRPDISSLGPKGENVVEILVDDNARHGGDTCTKVSEWFKDELNHSVSLERYSEYSRIILRPIDSDLSIMLSETGAGFSQVLPIVVQNTIAQKNSSHCGHALITEQPELHLHPAVHGAVADLYIATMQCGSGFIVIETHSEELIMRIRRRIAEGLEAGLVSIWSVGHGGPDADGGSIAHITFDNDGNPSDWPEGVFEESFIELGKLRSAVRMRNT